jgi:hypothetical protein
MMIIRQAGLGAALALGMAAFAEAQVAGIPVYYNPSGGTGFSVAGNLGFPNDDAGGGSAYAVSGGLGAGPLYFTATLGRRDLDQAGVDAEMTYGATASFRLIGGGLMPVAVAVQGGVGYVDFSGTTSLDIPVGVAIAPSLPLFPLKPWFAPRVHYTRVEIPSGTGSSTESATSLGFSAGVNFNLLLGLGFHAAVDVVKVSDKLDPDEPTFTTFGIGAHWNFRVPLM